MSLPYTLLAKSLWSDLWNQSNSFPMWQTVSPDYHERIWENTVIHFGNGKDHNDDELWYQDFECFNQIWHQFFVHNAFIVDGMFCLCDWTKMACLVYVVVHDCKASFFAPMQLINIDSVFCLCNWKRWCDWFMLWYVCRHVWEEGNICMWDVHVLLGVRPELRGGS
jgi:hypothetical protein